MSLSSFTALSAFQLFGRLHPLVLHLPIGLLVGVLVLEILATRGQVTRRALALVVWIAALSAVLTASAGWVLSHEDGYGGEVIDQHERLGIAVAVLAVLAAALQDASGRSRARLGLYRTCLVATCVLLLPTGHLGATLTHGADWLTGTKRAPRPAPSETPEQHDPPTPALPDTYETVIAPIFAARCAPCHGPTKHKAQLRLDSREALLAGGESGPALVPGDAEQSLFLKRATLPLEHEDHMPPEGKPQPSAVELAALAAWVRAGAPFSGHVELGVSVPAIEPAPTAPPPASPEAPKKVGAREELSLATEQALAALDRALVHHEWLRPDAGALWVDVAAVAPTFGDAELATLLVPLGAEIEELSLARSAIGDEALRSVARFPRLARLDLCSTAITDVGLAALAGHAALRELVLVDTQLGDAAVDVLVGLPRLAKVSLWRSGLSGEALARLRAARPELSVNAGDEPAAAELEVEAPLAFTSDRPLPGAQHPAGALAPINTLCPVSGSPINPKYAVLFEGRVIGFCCPNCPKEFWSDPARYADKLP